MKKNETPLVSFVIPAYNIGEDISACIDSINSQNYQNIEIVVVDDGSSDDTFDVINRMAGENPRIRPFHKENGGAFEARLYGVSKAEGDWIMFSDADDTVTADAVTGLIKHATDGVDIVEGRTNMNNRCLSRCEVSGHLEKQEYVRALFDSVASISLCAKLIRRSLFDKGIIHPSKKIINFEDMLMLFSLIRNSIGAYVAEDVICYNYIFRDNSMRFKSMEIDGWTYLYNQFNEIASEYNNPRINEALWHWQMREAYSAIIMRGRFVKKDTELYHMLVDKATLFPWRPIDAKLMKIIDSEEKQKRTRRINRTMQWIKQRIKKVLTILGIRK